ncbi:MAG: ADP-ribosylation factor-like protein, partial [Candidatus Latescibacterota bacterium]
YTVPGQVYYNATRKLVLKGADAVVFVADSSRSKMEENVESLRNLEENLNEHDLTLDTVPWVIQYNKRDAEDAMSVQELDEQLNLLKVRSFEAVATEGSGIYETFQGVARLLYLELKKRFEGVDASKSKRIEEAQPAVTTEKSKDRAASYVVESPPRQNAAGGVAGGEDGRALPVQTAAAAPREKAIAPAAAGAMHESVSSVVDNALREIDSPPSAESEAEDADNQIIEQNGIESDEYQFPPIDDGDGDLGRVLNLDDTPAPHERLHSLQSRAKGNGFLKDPCRTQVCEEEPACDIAHEVQVDLQTDNDSAGNAPLSSDPTFTVPIVISRSQLRKTIPIKLVLEIQVSEDEEKS